MSELKPCPFCGSKDVRLVDGDEYSWCMNPTCAIYDYEIRINEWNNRAESQELAALREQVNVLREALERITNKDPQYVHGFDDQCACPLCQARAALDQTTPKEGE